MQVIVALSGTCCTWARWGRTGTAGQSQLWQAQDEDDAVKIFCEKYEEKTGEAETRGQDGGRGQGQAGGRGWGPFLLMDGGRGRASG